MLTQNATWCQNRGCICISSVRRTYGRIHIPANNNSVDRIISKEEEREDPRRELQSIFEYSGVSTNNTRTTVIPCYSTYRINSSTRILQEILQLQGSFRAGSFQQLFPVSPSILHGRIRLPASLQHSRATQHKQASSNSTRQKQHSKRQPASTQPLQ